jgi:hypothetical protein
MLGAIVGGMVGSVYEFDNHRSKDFPLFWEDPEITGDVWSLRNYRQSELFSSRICPYTRKIILREGPKMNQEEFIDQVVRVARAGGFKIEINRNNQMQIDFGNKKLHSGHLAQLFPDILSRDANIAKLIEAVAPGRPCTHKPMREIVAKLTESA